MHLIAIEKKITHRSLVEKKENFMGILGTLRAILFILACIETRNSTGKNFD